MYWQHVNKIECSYLHKRCKNLHHSLCLGRSSFLPGREVQLVEQVSCCKTDCREWWTSLHRRPANSKWSVSVGKLYSWMRLHDINPMIMGIMTEAEHRKQQIVWHNYFESECRIWDTSQNTNKKTNTSKISGLLSGCENLCLYYSLMWYS